VECHQLLHGNDVFDYMHVLFLQAASLVGFTDMFTSS